MMIIYTECINDAEFLAVKNLIIQIDSNSYVDLWSIHIGLPNALQWWIDKCGGGGVYPGEITANIRSWTSDIIWTEIYSQILFIAWKVTFICSDLIFQAEKGKHDRAWG
mgnify:CR=1 FL=1